VVRWSFDPTNSAALKMDAATMARQIGNRLFMNISPDAGTSAGKI
jgi:hypothetical protein